MPDPHRTLVVRLRNWVGDVTLGVPTLQRLADDGYALQLVGKRWAGDLLAGHGWPVHVLPKTLRERVALLRKLRDGAGGSGAAAATRSRPRVDALCLPDSFSSALEMRLAGLRAIGHAHEGRSLLLSRPLRRPVGRHELEIYWAFADALLGSPARAPASIGLRISDEHRGRAAALRDVSGIGPDAIFICPFAGGTWAKQDKTWPAFAAFVAEVLPSFGRTVAICPGPGEETIARDRFPAARALVGVDLGTYAALLAEAPLMIANDTGPGHLAAAVGTPLVSVLGPSDPVRWRAWGPRVRLVRGSDGAWPTQAAVADAVDRALASG